jgi:hypothetical protein
MPKPLKRCVSEIDDAALADKLSGRSVVGNGNEDAPRVFLFEFGVTRTFVPSG